MKLNKFLALTAVFATLFAGCGNSTSGGEALNNGSNTTSETKEISIKVDGKNTESSSSSSGRSSSGSSSSGGGSNPYYDNPGYYDPGMNPGSGGGNQDNSYWEDYYRDTYKRWENRVSEWINDLNWARTNDMKQMLIGTYIQNVHDAQREMRNLRSEAASKGINIPMSSYENISVY